MITDRFNVDLELCRHPDVNPYRLYADDVRLKDTQAQRSLTKDVPRARNRRGDCQTRKALRKQYSSLPWYKRTRYEAKATKNYLRLKLRQKSLQEQRRKRQVEHTNESELERVLGQQRKGIMSQVLRIPGNCDHSNWERMLKRDIESGRTPSINPYRVFAQEHRRKVRNQLTGETTSAVNSTLRELYRSLPQKQKLVYLDKATEYCALVALAQRDISFTNASQDINNNVEVELSLDREENSNHQFGNSQVLKEADDEISEPLNAVSENCDREDSHLYTTDAQTQQAIDSIVEIMKEQDLMQTAGYSTLQTGEDEDEDDDDDGYDADNYFSSDSRDVLDVFVVDETVSNLIEMSMKGCPMPAPSIEDVGRHRSSQCDVTPGRHQAEKRGVTKSCFWAPDSYIKETRDAVKSIV